ncbi:MAG: hypothetical protein Q6365_015720 [Candidatus Sigynarchaeota archaeon]
MLLFGWILKFDRLPQLDDFSGEIVYKIVDMTTAQDRTWLHSTNAYYLVVKKRRTKGQKSMPSPSSTCRQLSLLDFRPTKVPKRFQMPRHFKINVVSKDAFVKDTIPDLEYFYYKTFKSCRGTFHYLVSLNDFSVFDKFQLENPAVQRACGRFSLADLVKIRLFMYKLGFKNYEHFYRAVSYMPFLPRELDLETIERVKHMPHVSTLERALHVAGSRPVMRFFYQLLQESVTYRLVDFKVLMIDGTFIHANCSNSANQATGKYSDPDAGYRRHRGKRFGAGYLADCVSSHQGTYALPVHFRVYPGHVNEAGIFSATYKSIPLWIKGGCKILLGDKGKYSMDNCTLVHDDGIVPIIDAPPNIVKHHLVDTPRKHRFNTDYIPPAWIPELDRIYALRGLHEASFSQDSLVYPGKRLNGYTIDIATQHFAFLKCLDHLTMLTAYKTGRPDLAWSSTAFTAPAINLSMDFLEQEAEASGYSLLDDYAKKNEEDT